MEIEVKQVPDWRAVKIFGIIFLALFALSLVLVLVLLTSWFIGFIVIMVYWLPSVIMVLMDANIKKEEKP